MTDHIDQLNQEVKDLILLTDEILYNKENDIDEYTPVPLEQLPTLVLLLAGHQLVISAKTFAVEATISQVANALGLEHSFLSRALHFVLIKVE